MKKKKKKKKRFDFVFKATGQSSCAKKKLNVLIVSLEKVSKATGQGKISKTTGLQVRKHCCLATEHQKEKL